MTGILSQIIALAAHGNNYLRSNQIPEHFFKTNSTFTFCNSVDFKALKKPMFSSKIKEILVAENPENWFEYLKKNDCKALRLYHQPSSGKSFEKDYKTAGFVGGGGTWFIETTYHSYIHYWASKWEATEDKPEDKKVWSVSYGKMLNKQKKNRISSNTNLDAAKTRIFDAITTAIDFSTRMKLVFWKEQFEQALNTLQSEQPEAPCYHKDLLPKDLYNLQTRQLLCAASLAWVFGGMGSWNDQSFELEENNQTYEEISEELFTAINEAVMTSVNSISH